MTFSEINDLENGQQISSFEGTVKKVFDQKTDVGQYGQWWLQNLILQDDHANELTVTWACEDAWTQNDEGKRLHFEAGRDKKDQLAGIKREIRNKNGKKYESVKVDDRAKVTTISQTVKTADIPKQEVDPDWPKAEKPPITEFGTSKFQMSKPSMLDERQRAIIRQHSQTAAIEVLKLKQMLGELSVEDLTPSKITQLSNYFDADVLNGIQ